MAENAQKTGDVTAPQTAANTNASPSEVPFSVDWFTRDHRIHIEDGSHFLPNNFLMVHPGELAPENQQRLFSKLVKHLALPAPSFFEFYPRNAVMFSLASYLPISRESRLASLKDQTEKLEEFARTGIHPDGGELIERYLRPFQSNAKLRQEEPEIDAADKEFLTSSITLYLVLNEALTAQGRPKEPAAYVERPSSADTILAQITDKLGMRMSEFVELSQTKGIPGIAEKLGVAPEALAEIEHVAKLAAEHHYTDNAIINWDVGRQTPGMQNRSPEEKIAVGLLQRAGGLLAGLHQQIPTDAPVPEDVQKAEQRIVAMLRELPKPLAEALFYSGTELGFITSQTLGPVRPQLGHAGGVNWHVPFETGGTGGMRQIINSNLDSRGYSRRVLHHEVNHLFFPKQLGEEGLKQLEDLIQKDASRLRDLRDALDVWKAAETSEAQEAEAQKIDKQFRIGEIGLTEALGLKSGRPLSLDTLHQWVDHALQNLDPDSKSLTRGYPMPELRAAEIISRFSELQFVDLADQPAMLGFIAPSLMVGYHDIFLPHIEKQVQEFKVEQEKLPPQLRYLGLPPGTLLPQTEQDVTRLQPAASVTDAPDDKPVAIAPNATVHSESIAAQMPVGVTSYLDKIHAAQQVETDFSASEMTR